MLEQLQYVAMYVPDVPSAVRYYESLGLQVQETISQAVGVHRVVLRFPRGSTALVLHDDAKAQFTDVVVQVPDVTGAHRQLSRNPDIVWLETPKESGTGRQATMRGPDGNVIVLLEVADSDP